MDEKNIINQEDVENKNTVTSLDEETSQDTEEETNIYNVDAINTRVQLQEKLNAMNYEDRVTLTKIVQYETIMDTIKAVKNHKKTKPETWKQIINKLNNLKSINMKDEKFDFKELLTLLIPILGALAGCFLSIRAAEKAEIEAAEPTNNPLTDKSEPALDCDEIFENNKRKSIVLQYCSEKEKEFSL